MLELLLDVGNTRLKWGIHQQGDAGYLATGAMPLEFIETLAAELASHPRATSAIGCVVAGAVVRARVNAQLALLDLKCNWITPRSEQCGIQNGYRYPSLLGADRWAAILGGATHAPKDAYLVINVGTAVTIDCVTQERHYLGGLILPGFGLMLKALEMGTAGLRVPPGDVTEFPDNTSDALMTGGALAIAGAAEQMYGRLQRRTITPPVVLLTGGASTKLEDALGLHYHNIEHLVFDGLQKISQTIAK